MRKFVSNPLFLIVTPFVLGAVWLITEVNYPVAFRWYEDQIDMQRMDDSQEFINKEIVKQGGVPHALPSER